MDVLIDAVAKAPAHLQVHAEIIGGGEVKGSLQAQVKQLGLEGRVVFRGLVSDEELRRAYQRADVFVMPGTAELQSLVTLEAMSASTPVLLADAMALPHLVDAGRNGYLFQPGNSNELSERLTSILELDPAERAAMGAHSRSMVDRKSVV